MWLEVSSQSLSLSLSLSMSSNLDRQIEQLLIQPAQRLFTSERNESRGFLGTRFLLRRADLGDRLPRRAHLRVKNCHLLKSGVLPSRHRIAARPVVAARGAMPPSPAVTQRVSAVADRLVTSDAPGLWRRRLFSPCPLVPSCTSTCCVVCD